TMRSGCGMNDQRLVKTLTGGAMEQPAFLALLGLAPDEDMGRPRLIRPLGASVPRVASVDNATGPAILREVKKRLRNDPLFTEHLSCRATELLTEQGRVIGAKIYDRKKNSFFSCLAASTLLATGGFCRLFPKTTTPPDLGGDGIAMAYRAGARLRDMEFIQFEPCSAVFPESLRGKSVITTLFYEGAALRNKRGERFLLAYGPEGERLQKDVLSLRMAREINSGGGAEHGGLYLDCTAVPEEQWSGVYEPYYRRYRSVGIDLKTTPVEVAPAAHTSLGGVVIDEACRTTVPGLFACGEVTGGLHGANRLGGNAGTETLVFGRIAGQTAAREQGRIPDDKPFLEPDRPAANDIPEKRRKLAGLLQNELGVVRTEKGLRSALTDVEAMLASPLSNASFEEARLKNDLVTARCALTVALNRKDSIGCHVREE
ncbi:MAG: FAD-binding protein, partial [Clostridia bacterium]|nr:FAD-binding protein [Clostridia bacterium]